MLKKNRIHIGISLLCVLFAAAFQGACSVTGKTLKPDRLFELKQGESHQGKLETKDLTFTYQYNRKGDSMSLTGDIEFIHRRVRQFKMEIHFVDAQGMVLNSVPVPISKGSLKGTNSSVQIDQQVPPDTRSIAFSYSGEIRNIDDRSISFWRVP